MEERFDSLEKQLADEKRQRFILQIEYDQEKEKIDQHIRNCIYKLYCICIVNVQSVNSRACAGYHLV